VCSGHRGMRAFKATSPELGSTCMPQVKHQILADENNRGWTPLREVCGGPAAGHACQA
jgi:hypothetical protein